MPSIREHRRVSIRKTEPPKAAVRKLKQTRWWRRKQEHGVCFYCGQNVSKSELTLDHVIPIAKGGASTRSNLKPCCKQCNTAKGSAWATEFIKA